ncbi:MAG: hypothetical protein ACYSYV_08370 [Planctomycetota bacterium]|jgi:hypothetical protein
MADYDSNMIKPVEGLQNITGLAPARRREERKRRQQPDQENRDKGESAGDNETLPEGQTENGNDRDSAGIDYCA